MSWLYIVAFAALIGLMFYILLGKSLAVADKATKIILLTTAVLVPLVSLGIYQQRGAFDEVSLVETMQSLSQQSEESSMEAIKKFQRQLEEVSERHPDRAEYGFILGDLYMELQNYQSAVNAFQMASAASPNDISIVSRLTEAQFVADDYFLTDAVKVHVDRVLAVDPLDTTVLGILGISAYRAGQYEAAIRFWENSLSNLPPFSPTAQSIQSSIEQAKIAAGETTQGNANESNAHQQVNIEPVAGLYIDVDVSLDPSISADPSATVFVFARQVGGPPMPVVVERINVASLPVRLRMDDSKVMIQGRGLADFEQLELVARLSFSGSPTAVAGDYETVYGPLNPQDVDSVIRLQITDLVTD